jgi:hypothetical protein
MTPFYELYLANFHTNLVLHKYVKKDSKKLNFSGALALEEKIFKPK